VNGSFRDALRHLRLLKLATLTSQPPPETPRTAPPMPPDSVGPRHAVAIGFVARGSP
jgi:hypothetical protein